MKGDMFKTYLLLLFQKLIPTTFFLGLDNLNSEKFCSN